MVLVSAGVALVAGGVWFALQGGGFRVKVALALLIVAAVIGVTGGTVLSRASTDRERAFLGMGPDREEPDTGEGLTGVGVFLFVSLPLFVIGGVLYGSG